MRTISCKEVSMEDCDYSASAITLEDARANIMEHVKKNHGEMKEDERASMMGRMENSWNQKPSL